MIDRPELLRLVAREYANLTGSRRVVRPSDRLQDDLHIDSLSAQELLIALEDELGVEVMTDPRVADVRTVGDLVELLADAMPAEAARM